MNIAITGATGFLGLNAANYFTQQGHNVTGFGRNKQKGQKLLGKFVAADINDFERMAPYFDGVDYVIHSAALSSPWGKPSDFMTANVNGTQTVLKLCEKYSIKKLIHISSPSLYFQFEDELNIKENKPLSPPFASTYTHTKWLAENLIDQSAVPCITLRPRGIFGPGDESLLPRLFKAAGKKGLPQFGDGQNIIDITYVDNVTQAIECALKASENYNGQKYNITNGEPVKIWELLDHLFKELGLALSPRKVKLAKANRIAHACELLYKAMPFLGEPPLTRYTVGLLCYSQTLDISKAQRELDYFPKVTMHEAVANVVKWWRQSGS